MHLVGLYIHIVGINGIILVGTEPLNVDKSEDELRKRKEKKIKYKLRQNRKEREKERQ